jgi:hypothetical protein
VGKSKVINRKEIVKAFIKYFITVVENLAMKNADKNEAIKLLNTFKYDNLPELRLK